MHCIDFASWIYQGSYILIFIFVVFSAELYQILNARNPLKGSLLTGISHWGGGCQDWYLFFNTFFLGSEQSLEWCLFLLQLKYVIWNMIFLIPLLAPLVRVELVFFRPWSRCWSKCQYFFFSLQAFLLEVSLLLGGGQLDGFGTRSDRGFLIGLSWRSQVEKAYKLLTMK